MPTTGRRAATCRDCSHFVDDPTVLETLFKGLQALSSAYGASRGEAGICSVDDSFRNPSAACDAFTARHGAAETGRSATDHPRNDESVARSARSRHKATSRNETVTVSHPTPTFEGGLDG